MRAIEVLYFAQIAERTESLPIRNRHFLLLLAWDAGGYTPEQLVNFFRPLVDRGLVYFCAWGSNCAAVHDAIDRCDIQNGR